MITIDFETRSTVDLKKCGTSVYARHPSTQILCLAYAFGPEAPRLWKPGDAKPEALLDAVAWGIEHIEAHNVFFERNIWRWICHARMGWPDVKADVWRCSMAACCRLTFPRSLAQAGEAIGTVQKKDDAGHKIMMRLSKPKSGTTDRFDNDPAKFRQLYEYCKQDVVAEREISRRIEPLTPAELRVWQLDQKINLRGLAVDVPALKNALSIVDQTYRDCCESISKITGGQVKSPKQVAAIGKWIEIRMGEKPEKLDAETVAAWLERDDLPKAVNVILQLRQIASKASTAKIKSMLSRCDEDGRVRGNLVYHGATTGRWAGSGIQIQNYPRGTLSSEEINLVHRLLPSFGGRALDLLLGPPIDCISSSLRSMVRAGEGNRLLVCDFASIEARVLAWLAGEEDLLATFATGGDVYKGMAEKIYDVDEDEVTKTQRHVGKTAILGLGYGMGWRAFVDTCWRMAGVVIDNSMSKRVVKVYRDTNSEIRDLWGSVQTACIEAIETGKLQRVGGKLEVTYDRLWLRIKLPSGRHLHYYDPELIEVIAPWSEGYRGEIAGDVAMQPTLENLGIELGERTGNYWSGCDVPKGVNRILAANGVKARLEKKKPQHIKQIQFMGVDSMTRKWTKKRTYGAQLVENVTQGIARDFLVEAMFRCEQAGYEIVATVHDEIIAERPVGEGSLSEFESIMRAVPRWGRGCPIEVEGFESIRYRK